MNPEANILNVLDAIPEVEIDVLHMALVFDTVGQANTVLSIVFVIVFVTTITFWLEMGGSGEDGCMISGKYGFQILRKYKK